MTGGAIVAGTLATIGLAVFLIWLSASLFSSVGRKLTSEDTGTVTKLLLVIPFLILGAWCLLIDIMLTVITLGAITGIATNFRNWWNRC